MNALTSTVFAMLCYALGNCILEAKFSRYDALTVLVAYTGIIFIAMLTLRLFSGSAATDETSWLHSAMAHLPLWPLLAMGIVFAMADYFYVGAYAKGASATMTTSILILIPVVVSVIKYANAGAVPNAWQLGGYLCGALSILMIAKGTT